VAAAGAGSSDVELKWLREVYAGDDVPQLTLRALCTGVLLGGLMAFSNLYVSLKTGWSLGVTITAALLAYAIWSGLKLVLPGIRPFGPLENNAMQSVASAAAYMTGGGTVAAIPALMMLTNYHFDRLSMMLWIGTLALLGVFVAIPLKRQMVNIEQLRFPTGLASAEMVRSLHAEGSEARQKARFMMWAVLVGAALVIVRDVLHLVPEKVALFGAAAAAYTLSVELSLVMVGAGALMGPRTVLSQLAGSILCYAVLAPWAHGIGAIADPVKYKTVVSWSVWFGASMMLTAGLLQFFLGWRSIARAFADLGSVLRPARAARADGYRDASEVDGVVDPMARLEVPMTWFLGGLLVLGPASAVLARVLFDIPLWMGFLTVAMSLLVGVVASRVTGETDTTPSGALGKLVQLIFGVLHPGSITTNLMTAQMSAGVAIHASDLLTDLKSGHVLGAKPRHQFFAQLAGVVTGTLVVVPLYMVFVPDASVLGTDRWPAPAAQSWGAVAKLLAVGVSTLHPTARVLIGVGGAVGVALVLIERAFPKAKPYLPSGMAFGLAFTLPGWNSISMAVGGMLAFAIERRNPKLASLAVVTVAGGLIAGESLIGGGVSLFQALQAR
jgi:OPT family oligopeptide transporter